MFKNKKLNQILNKRIEATKDNLLSFYIETNGTITSMLEHNSKYEKNLKYASLTNLAKSFGRRKDKYYKKEILEYYSLKKNNVLFVGSGGLGKTHQLYNQHERNAESVFINSADIPLIHRFVEIKRYIQDPNNIIFIDALNEGSKNSVETFLHKVKCKVFATTRPSFSTENISAKFFIKKLHVSINSNDLAIKLGIMNSLPPEVLAATSQIEPRLAMKLFRSYSVKSKIKRKPRSLTPIEVLRDMVEQYIKLELKSRKIPTDNWNNFKNTKFLLGRVVKPVSKVQLKNMMKNFKQPSEMYKFLLEENIVQSTEGKIIISDINLFRILKVTELLRRETININCINEVWIKKFMDNMNIWINNKLAPIFLGEIFYRLLKQGNTPDQIIKNMLEICYPIEFKISREMIKCIDDYFCEDMIMHEPEFQDKDGELVLKIIKHEPWAPKSFGKYMSTWIIVAALPFALKANNMKYTLPEEIISDYNISSFHPVLLNEFLPNSNSFYFNELDRKTWLKDDLHLINAVVGSPNTIWKSWFIDWIWTSPIFIFNSLVQTKKYNAKNLLIKMIVGSKDKTHSAWWVIACLYKNHNLKFDISKYAKEFGVSNTYASFTGFKNTNLKKTKLQFKKLLKNKLRTLKLTENKKPIRERDNQKYYQFLKHAGNYLCDDWGQSFKWENVVTDIFDLMGKDNFEVFVDKYFLEFDADYKFFAYNISASTNVFDVTLKNVNQNFELIKEEKINPLILQYDAGTFSIDADEVQLGSFSSASEYVVFSPNERKTYCGPGLHKKEWFKNGFLLKANNNRYIGIKYKEKRYFIDKEKKLIYDYDEDFEVNTKTIWINERGIDQPLILEKIINKIPPS